MRAEGRGEPRDVQGLRRDCSFGLPRGKRIDGTKPASRIRSANSACPLIPSTLARPRAGEVPAESINGWVERGMCGIVGGGIAAFTYRSSGAAERFSACRAAKHYKGMGGSTPLLTPFRSSGWGQISVGSTSRAERGFPATRAPRRKAKPGGGDRRPSCDFFDGEHGAEGTDRPKRDQDKSSFNDAQKLVSPWPQDTDRSRSPPAPRAIVLKLGPWADHDSADGLNPN